MEKRLLFDNDKTYIVIFFFFFLLDYCKEEIELDL